MNRVEIDVRHEADHLDVRWTDGRRRGACRFDHLPGTSPEWLGSADELLDGADRRLESSIIDAVSTWAKDAGLDVGVWHDDAGVESLV